jgi:excinuclease UvrABC nuclease subunit
MSFKWKRVRVKDRYELPVGPGVYVFLRGRRVLYVGISSQSVYHRVCRGHFGTSGKGSSLKDSDWIAFSQSLKYGEELMREARLIRHLQPSWNQRGKQSPKQPLFKPSRYSGEEGFKRWVADGGVPLRVQ